MNIGPEKAIQGERTQRVMIHGKASKQAYIAKAQKLFLSHETLFFLVVHNLSVWPGHYIIERKDLVPSLYIGPALLFAYFMNEAKAANLDRQEEKLQKRYSQPAPEVQATTRLGHQFNMLS